MNRYTNRLLAKLFTAFPALSSRWGKGLDADTGTIPWAKPIKPLREACLALVTTGGVHLTTQQPFDMANPEGDASFREVSVNTPRETLAITHDYYDHRDAEADLNLVFPTERLRELVTEGVVKSFRSPAISLMGHINGRQLRILRESTAPAIAGLLASSGVDYVLLVPA